ncbi:biotin/lipoyl-binding protein [Cryobacterium sp. Hh11]|nr:biotin/lipoyl-binding protein [Cryobacterium sp. Hh11]
MSTRTATNTSAAASAVENQPSAKKLRAARQKHRRLLAVGTVTAVLVASGGGVAYALTRAEGGDCRTVAAALGSVSESLDLVGTLASASRSDASFSVAGTVSSVAVSLRDTVTAGQTLATLDVASLNDAIAEAEANVASAQLTLESDLDSQTATSTTSTVTTDAVATSTTSAASGAGATSGGLFCFDLCFDRRGLGRYGGSRQGGRRRASRPACPVRRGRDRARRDRPRPVERRLGRGRRCGGEPRRGVYRADFGRALGRCDLHGRSAREWCFDEYRGDGGCGRFRTDRDQVGNRHR